MTKRQLEIAAARRQLLVELAGHLESGATLESATFALRLSPATVWRLLKLCPDPLPPLGRCRWLLAAPMSALAPSRSPGSPGRFRDLAQLEEVRVELKKIYLATLGASSAASTRGRRTGSATLALREFAESELCPPHLASVLRAGTQPAPLLRILREITPAIEGLHRGPKHYDSARIVGRRGLFIILADGTRIPVHPGKVWVFDDMSSNFPFWFEAPRDLGAQNKLVERHGAAIGRQGLYAWDHGSAAWLGIELVGRVRDAYTADTILRFFRRLMETYGKPDFIILERGVWASRSIQGFEFVADAPDPVIELFSVPAMPAEDYQRLSNGIEALGIHLRQSHSPRDKAIETAFNYFQDVFAVKARDTGAVNIGRYGGEFERAAKQMRRAGAGVKHPAELGFLHIHTHADLGWRCAEFDNGERPKGERAGMPAALLAAGLQARPNAPLTDVDRAVFLPETRRDRMIRGAHVTVAVEGRSYRYCDSETFAALGDGALVTIKFDPAEPALPAAIYHQDRLLGFAELSEDAPIIDLSDGEKVPARNRAYHKFNRTEYRAINPRTRQAVKQSEIRDGRGNMAVSSTEQTRNPTTVPRGTKPFNAPTTLSRPASEDPELAEFYSQT